MMTLRPASLSLNSLPSGRDIAEYLNQPSAVVDHILRRMWDSGRVKAQGMPRGLIYIHEATPELRASVIRAHGRRDGRPSQR
jgi:hypothetical protein